MRTPQNGAARAVRSGPIVPGERITIPRQSNNSVTREGSISGRGIYMKSLRLRLVFTALAVIALAAVNHGCSDDPGPAGPLGPGSSGTFAPLSMALTDCGTSDYFTDLSPVLVNWEDSLEAWLGEGLDSLPVYEPGKSPQAHLEELVPGLQQWESWINLSLDSTIVDTVASFDPTGISVPGYLVGLSDLLAGWKEALEAYRGIVFLDTPPLFEPDTTDPIIECPADTTVDCADSSGVEVMFAAVVMDDCDPSPVVTYDPEPGSVFPLGETMVTCTATDSSGNSAECTFMVTVEAASLPEIECPPDTTIECSGPDGVVFEYEVMATSVCDTALTVTCDPPSGSTFPVGETVVNCSASDMFNNTVECSFTVTVVAAPPPVIECPADITTECTDAGGTPVEWVVNATSECDLDITITCDPPSGSLFPKGTTTVTCVATDVYGGADTCSFDVTVVDTTPPTIDEAYATPGMLWPPNHKMVDVDVSVVMSDACDESLDCYIFDVTSSESVNGNGDGNTAPDWVITDDLSLQLRAERAGGGNSRTYYIHLICVDDSGNSTEHTVQVIVPHDRGNNRSSDDD